MICLSIKRLFQRQLKLTDYHRRPQGGKGQVAPNNILTIFPSRTIPLSFFLRAVPPYHMWRNRGGGFFFQGPWGVLIYAFISTILPLHESISDLIDLPSKLKPRKELKSRDYFFKILFVGWGRQKLESRTVGLKPT